MVWSWGGLWNSHGSSSLNLQGLSMMKRIRDNTNCYGGEVEVELRLGLIVGFSAPERSKVCNLIILVPAVDNYLGACCLPV